MLPTANLLARALDLDIVLTIHNRGEHWMFQCPGGLLAEWWPSTGRLVYNKQWKKFGIVRDPSAVLHAIAKRLPKPPPVRPAYQDRLDELM